MISILLLRPGNDAWEYEFLEEDFSAYKNSHLNEGISPVENRPTSLHLVNGDASDPPPAYAQTSDMDGRKKSVTFATNSPSPSGNSTASPISPNTPISSQGTVTGKCATIELDYLQLQACFPVF